MRPYWETDGVTLYHGDCLDILPTLDSPFDAVITDLPYGTTACKWDTVIPFEPMWEQVRRLLKKRGAFVTTASQPFTSALVMSNLKWFKYAWVWDKKLAGNGILANVQPLKVHEDICVFGDGPTIYNQQMRKGRARWKGGIRDRHGTFSNAESPRVYNNEYHPQSILPFSGAGMRNTRVHPTQKPVALYEYLIRTYTNEGDIVLDFVMGSGTTGVACVQTGRRFVGIDKKVKYVDITVRRIQEAIAKNSQLEMKGLSCASV